MAPEIFQNLVLYLWFIVKGHNCCVDWYSLGSFLYLLLAGVPPFYSGDKRLMLKQRLEKPIKMREWFSEEAKNILMGLLTIDVIYQLFKLQSTI